VVLTENAIDDKRESAGTHWKGARRIDREETPILMASFFAVNPELSNGRPYSNAVQDPKGGSGMEARLADTDLATGFDSRYPQWFARFIAKDRPQR
jgi:hypothetical protein